MSLSLWGRAPALIERLAHSRLDAKLEAEAEAWLVEARDSPRYDIRIVGLIDDAIQHLSDEDNPQQDRVEYLEQLMEEIKAGDWPQPVRDAS